jgi:MYXO-CTERM domain-containing protein
MSAPVPSGNMLFVGTWDGTIQALVHREGAPIPTGPFPTPTCDFAPNLGEDIGGGGCACEIGGAHGVGLSAILIAVAAVIVLRRKRR